MTRRNKRDFQRSKVYAWENAQSWSDKPGSIKRRLKEDGKWGIELTDPSPNTLSKIEILFIVEKLNKVFDLDIKVQCKPKSSHKAYYRDHGKLICIPMTWANNWSVLLHEYAHALTNNEIAHGKEFVTAYCNLLHYLHPSKPCYKELAKSLNDKNIDFVSLPSSDWDKKLKRVKIDLNKIPSSFINKFKPKKKVKSEYEKMVHRCRGRVYRLKKQYPHISVEKEYGTDYWYVDIQIGSNHGYVGYYLKNEDDDPFIDQHICYDYSEIEDHVLSYIEHFKDNPDLYDYSDGSDPKDEPVNRWVSLDDNKIASSIKRIKKILKKKKLLTEHYEACNLIYEELVKDPLDLTYEERQSAYFELENYILVQCQNAIQ